MIFLSSGVSAVTVTVDSNTLALTGQINQAVGPGGQQANFIFQSSGGMINNIGALVVVTLSAAAQSLCVSNDGSTCVNTITNPAAGNYVFSIAGFASVAPSSTLFAIKLTTAGSPVNFDVKGYLTDFNSYSVTAADLGAAYSAPYTNPFPGLKVITRGFGSPSAYADSFSLNIGFKYNGKSTRATHLVNFPSDIVSTSNTGTFTVTLPTNNHVITAPNTFAGALQKGHEATAPQAFPIDFMPYLAGSPVNINVKSTELAVSSNTPFSLPTPDGLSFNFLGTSAIPVSSAHYYVLYFDEATSTDLGQNAIYLEQATAAKEILTASGALSVTLLPSSSITTGTVASYENTLLKPGNKVQIIMPNSNALLTRMRDIVAPFFLNAKEYAQFIWYIPSSPTALNITNTTALNSTGFGLNSTGGLNLSNLNITCFGPVLNISFNTSAAGNLSNYTNWSDTIAFPTLNITNTTNGTASNGSVVICTDPGTVADPAVIVRIGHLTASTIPPLSIVKSVSGVSGLAAASSVITATALPEYAITPGFFSFGSPFRTGVISTVATYTSGLSAPSDGSAIVTFPVAAYIGPGGFATVFPSGLGWQSHNIKQVGSGAAMAGTATFTMSIPLAEYKKMFGGKEVSVANTNINAFKVAATTGAPFTSALATIQARDSTTNSIVITSASESSNFALISGTFTSSLTGYAFGSEANMTIYDQTDTVSRTVGQDVTFYASYYNKTGGASITGASCNASFSVDGTTQAMGYTAGPAAYFTTKTFSVAETTDWNVTCGGVGAFDTLWANDTVVIDPAATPPVPEFGTWALIIALSGVLVGLFTMRARQGL